MITHRYKPEKPICYGVPALIPLFLIFFFDASQNFTLQLSDASLRQ